MRPIRVMIVDDEHDARELLSSLLSQYSFVDVVGQAEGTDKALTMLEHVLPDLITVDIHMPFRDGFELVKALKAINYSGGIIFTTAYNSYAIKAIKYGVFDYWLKPIDQDELYESLIRFQGFRSAINTSSIAKLTFETSNGIIRVEPENILYLMKHKSKTEFTLVDNQEFSKVVKVTKEEVQILQQKLGWYQLMDDILINPDNVTEIDYQKRHLVLKGKIDKIILSDLSKEHLESLAEYL